MKKKFASITIFLAKVHIFYKFNTVFSASDIIGRLTLTNHALYFEASGVLDYEDALKLDLSKGTEKSVKPAATGPWGAPLFDKAIIYESPEL